MIVNTAWHKYSLRWRGNEHLIKTTVAGQPPDLLALRNGLIGRRTSEVLRIRLAPPTGTTNSVGIEIEIEIKMSELVMEIPAKNEASSQRTLLVVSSFGKCLWMQKRKCWFDWLFLVMRKRMANEGGEKVHRQKIEKPNKSLVLPQVNANDRDDAND